MGVHGLWRLLDSFGQVANPEAWSGRRVAIDASIWIAQFRAKTEIGDNVERRVLEGFFARILKLLFYNIEAIFVFDGNASELKTAEQRRRQRHREDAAQSFLRRRARQIVMAQVAAGVLDVRTLPRDTTATATKSRSRIKSSRCGKNMASRDALRQAAPKRVSSEPTQSSRSSPVHLSQDTPNAETAQLATDTTAHASKSSARTHKRARSAQATPVHHPSRHRWSRLSPHAQRMAPADVSAAVTSRFLDDARVRLDQLAQDTRRVTHNVLRHSSTALYMGPRRVLTTSAPPPPPASLCSASEAEAMHKSDPKASVVDVDCEDESGNFRCSDDAGDESAVVIEDDSDVCKAYTTGQISGGGGSISSSDDGVTSFEVESVLHDGSESCLRKTDSPTSSSDAIVVSDDDANSYAEDDDNDKGDGPEHSVLSSHYGSRSGSDNGEDVRAVLDGLEDSDAEYEDVCLTMKSQSTMSSRDNGSWCPGSQWSKHEVPCSSAALVPNDTHLSATPPSEAEFTPVKEYEDQPQRQPYPLHTRANLLNVCADDDRSTSDHNNATHTTNTAPAQTSTSDDIYCDLGETVAVTRSRVRTLPPDLTDIARLLELCGLPYVISPVEADAQCAFLCRAHLVDAVFSEDSDVVVHGAPVVLRGFFSTTQQVVEYRQAELAAVGLDKRVLVALAMLLGCDYTAGVAGVGLTSALDAIAVGWQPCQTNTTNTAASTVKAGRTAMCHNDAIATTHATNTATTPRVPSASLSAAAASEAALCARHTAVQTAHGSHNNAVPLLPSAPRLSSSSPVTVRQDVEAVRCVLLRWRALKERPPQTCTTDTPDSALTELQHNILTRRRLAWASTQTDQSFPSARVAAAFFCPTVDANTTPFVATAPDWEALRSFAGTRGLLTLHWVQQRYELARREFAKRTAARALRQQQQRELEAAHGKDGSAGAMRQSKLTDFGLQNKVGERWAFHKLPRTYAVALNHLREVQGREGGGVAVTT